MSIRTSLELAGIKRVGRVVALALQKMAAQLGPGITTGELNAVGERVVRAGLETFLSTGSSWVVPGDDGWTLRTSDGSLAAQYEHTVVVTSRGPLVVTRVDG